MSHLLKIAFTEIGEQEVPGANHNQRILDYASESGISGISTDEVPWCSTFVNWVAFEAGLSRTNKANARSWLLVGQNADSAPEPGDIIIFWRESPESWKGHVGFFLGYSQNLSRVYCLGGNQGNQVSISAYPASSVLGFRRLTPVGMINLPDAPLKKGDTGEGVKQLQDALKTVGFNSGTTDGHFGPKTEACLKQLQAASGILQVDGVYGKKTKNYLLSILNE